MLQQVAHHHHFAARAEPATRLGHTAVGICVIMPAHYVDHEMAVVLLLVRQAFGRWLLNNRAFQDGSSVLAALAAASAALSHRRFWHQGQSVIARQSQGVDGNARSTVCFATHNARRNAGKSRASAPTRPSHGAMSSSNRVMRSLIQTRRRRPANTRCNRAGTGRPLASRSAIVTRRPPHPGAPEPPKPTRFRRSWWTPHQSGPRRFRRRRRQRR